MFCAIVAMFLHTSPILAVLFVFVAYTLLRRSATIRNKVQYAQTTKETSEKKRDVQKQVNNATPPTETPRTVDIKIKDETTLEEQVVEERAPIGRSEPINFLQSSYKPVSTNVDGSAAF